MTITQDVATPQAPGPHHCAAIASTMIGHFVTRLEVEARKAGGTLTPEQIAAIAARFVTGIDRFAPVLKRSWDDCGTARDSAMWEPSRRNPLSRLMVKRFAHLFPARRGDDGGGEAVLSRRIIPGFNIALDKMLGPQLHDQCQRKANAIVERLRNPSGALDWNRAHRDPEIGALLNDILVVVAHYFTNFERRRDWFITLIDSHLGRSAGSAPDRNWVLTPALFHKLMLALFADLFAQLQAENGVAVRSRYGEHTYETLVEFLNKLNGLR